MVEHFELLCVLGFMIQLFICFRFRNAWIRMMPLFLILGAMTLNAGLYLVKSDLYYMVCVVIGGLILLASESAWIVYAMVKLFKKVKKDL